MYVLLFFLAIVVAPCVYLAMAFRSRRPTSFEEYHYAGRTIEPGEFVSSTVAYALQIAVLVLFVTWGYQYGFWTIWVPIFWGLGYLVLAYLVKRGKMDRFLMQEHLGTIHQFLGDRSQIGALALLTALVSLLGIAGPAMFEAFFAANISSRLIVDMGQPSSADALIDQYTKLFFWAFLLLAAIYMLYGGYRTIVRTDGVQLSIGYGAFSIALSLLLVRAAETSGPGPSTVLLVLLVVLSLCSLAAWRFMIAKRGHPTRRMVFIGCIVVPLCIYLAGLAVVIVRAGGDGVFSLDGFLRDQQFASPTALGGMMLLNLLIANALYQLVDIGQWQRLGSVVYDKENPKASRTAIAGYLRYIAVFSFISWIVAVCFGMALHYVPGDMSAHAFDELAAFMLLAQQSQSSVDKAIVLLLLISVGAVMFSTLDSLIAAIAFTAHNDILRGLGRRWQRPGIARLTTLVLLVACGLLYLFANARVANFAEILYASWAMQIGLFWVVVFALSKRPLSPTFALLSVGTGMGGALVPLFVGSPLSTYTHGAVFALAGSGVMAALATTIPGGRVSSEGG
ncbi:MAG: hypothetical protein KAS72_15265 [Phycisphaerales bacterium]|nr:hypothetical protein [Phycisphaerales bacterium]